MRRFRFRMNAVSVHAAILLLSGACIPYSVATTAQPVPKGETVMAGVLTVMPPIDIDDTTRQSPVGLDAEARFGIDSVSDLGVRIVSLSGLVFNYKRLLNGPRATTLFAIMPGFGFVNLFDHAHVELTLLASGRMPPAPPRATPGLSLEGMSFHPYAGLRLMHVIPLHSSAAEDQPTRGGFVGLRFGHASSGVGVEVGVYHDHPALGLRERSLVVVPSIVFHGDMIELMRMIPSGRGPVRRR